MNQNYWPIALRKPRYWWEVTKYVCRVNMDCVLCYGLS